eukprot:COSAG01_NODE_1175_length_11334_cov_23.401152_4_plen_92_part_00
MLIPMSCLTCNTRIGALHPYYQHLTLQQGMCPAGAFNKLRLDSVRHLCCRTMLLSYPNLYEAVAAQSCTNEDIPFVTAINKGHKPMRYDPV